MYIFFDYCKSFMTFNREAFLFEANYLSSFDTEVKISERKKEIRN